jgi:hypothetical protein
MASVEKVQTLIRTEGMPEGVIAEWESGAPNIRKVARAFSIQ